MRLLLQFACTAILVAWPTVARAHGGNDDPNAVHACVHPVTGIVRIVGVNGSCLTVPARLAELPVHWQIASGEGPPGPQGVPGPRGPEGPIGPIGPSSVAQVVTLDTPGSMLPQDFQDIRLIPHGRRAVQVEAGQRVLVLAEIEIEPAGNDPQGVLFVHLGIGYGPARPGDDDSPPVTSLPVGPPIGLPGRYNRLQTVHGVLTDLPAGTHDIGIAGLAYPEPGVGPVGVNRIRLTVLVLNP